MVTKISISYTVIYILRVQYSQSFGYGMEKGGSNYFIYIALLQLSMIILTDTLETFFATGMVLKEYLRGNLKKVMDSRRISKMIRGGFVIFGLGMVCNGFYKTMIKVNQRNILISEELVNEEKYTYPSITFCYKYKYGGKDVFQNYYPYLYEKWKKEGIMAF